MIEAGEMSIFPKWRSVGSVGLISLALKMEAGDMSMSPGWRSGIEVNELFCRK